MNEIDKDLKIQLLEEENKELKERLKKYTNPASYKIYYEANKEKINEKRRDYAREYYHKKKELNKEK